LKKSFSEIVGDIDKNTRARLLSKVPEWEFDGLEIPARLNMEQCSSSATALIKAKIAAGVLARAGRIADLTGGLGVDCWAFSRHFAEVLYNDMNPALVEAVKHNFALLGVKNVEFRCSEVLPGEVKDLLGNFCPDLIFLDPARRSEKGDKLFFLEDCSPDITALREELLGIAPKIMVKLSPMADLSLVCAQLGSCLEKAFILGAEGECKELLVMLGRSDNAAGVPLTLIENGVELSFSAEELRSGTMPSLCELSSLKAGSALFVPSASLMKTGAYAALCQRFEMEALGRSTHIFRVAGDLDQCRRSLSPFGKFRQVIEVLPFGKAAFRELGKKYPRAEVTARNLPLNSDALRAKLGISSGGFAHIYGLSVDRPEMTRCLIVTKDIS